MEKIDYSEISSEYEIDCSKKIFIDWRIRVIRRTGKPIPFSEVLSPLVKIRLVEIRRDIIEKGVIDKFK